MRPCPNGTPDAMPSAPSALRPGPRSSGVSATGADRRRPGRDSPIRGADGGHSRIDRDRWGGLDARRHGAALAGIGRSSGRPGVRGRPPPGPRGTSARRLPPSSSAGSSGPTSASEPPCGRGSSGSTTSVPAPFQAGIGYTTTSSRDRSRPRRARPVSRSRPPRTEPRSAGNQLRPPLLCHALQPRARRRRRRRYRPASTTVATSSPSGPSSGTNDPRRSPTGSRRGTGSTPRSAAR